MRKLITKILVFMAIVVASYQVTAGNYSQSVCAGNSVSIGNVYPTATLYQWNTVPPQYTAQITVNPTTNTSYIVNVFVGTNWLLADTFNIVVNPLPNGSISPTSQSICVGTSAMITATGGVNYLWSNGANTPSINVTPSVTTTFTCLITGSNGCSISLSSTVTVNPLPTIMVGSNSPVCSSNSINLTGTGTTGAIYLWSGPNNFGSNLQNPTITNVTSANAGSYTVTATLNGCSTSINTAIVVNPLPTVIASSNSPVCSSMYINLNATVTPGSTCYWYGPDGFTSTIQNPAIINVDSSNAGVYTLIATLNGCSVNSSTNVVVNPLPTVIASSNSPICSSMYINLNATVTPGSTFYWYGPDGFTSTIQNPAIINVDSSNAGVYTLIATLNGCSVNSSTNVVVNPLPTVTANSSGTVCEGASAFLFANGTGTTHYWYGPNGFISTLQNPVITNITGANAGTYTVISTLNGCSANSSTNVVVNPTPVVSITGATNICTGQSTTLTASGTGTYLWSNGATTNAIPTSTAGTYSVVVTGTNGCSSQPTFTNVIVNPQPSVNITPSSFTICDGETVTLNAYGANSYLWSNGTTGSSIMMTPSTTTTYYVTVTNASGCTGTGNVTVTVNPTPNVLLNLQQTQICEDANPLTLTGGTPVGGVFYGSGIFGNGMFYSSSVGVGAFQIYYQYTNTYGCTGTGSQLLTVNPNPVVSFNPIPQNPVGVNDSPFQLNTGTPVGGVYSGPGVNGGNVYPSYAGVGQHQLTYTYTDPQTGCLDIATTNLIVLPWVGIDEVGITEIKVYPNPVSDILNVEMGEIPDIVELISSAGALLRKEVPQSGSFKVDVSYLPSGEYLLRLSLGNGDVKTAKIIKK